MSKILFCSAIVVVAIFFISSTALGLSGAIYTTDAGCTGVNVNLFNAKDDVYLDGGPQGNSGSGLPDGFYDVQVTVPSGQLLGSTFGTALVHVTNGSFDQCYQLSAILTKASDGTAGYDDTTNGGGVYKVWVTQNYTPGEGVNGFIQSDSKTDNFKVEESDTCQCCPAPSIIRVSKFDDTNANGVKDENEPEIESVVDINDPQGGTNSETTGFDLLVTSGLWKLCEQTVPGWQQTALIIDGVPADNNCTCLSKCASVQVNSDCNEVHEVVFGNIQFSSITACKFYDADGNGVNNNELPVEGIKFILDGNDILGNHVIKDANTGPCGCVFFRDLLPGTYTVCEVLPQGWVATTDECKTIVLTEGNDVSFEFGNVCVGTADFGTKGYWHNNNGLAETFSTDISYLNGLAPWQPGVLPFGAINGFKGATALRTKIGSTTYTGSKAEQSIFLVYSNGDYKLQLAQQLDAFIMNVRHRLDNPNAYIQLPNGKWVKASDLITSSVTIWQSGSSSTRTCRSSLLNALNNSIVLFIHPEPCPLTTPCDCTCDD